jgi:hypothetical protein
MLAGLRTAPLQDFETLIPALPGWTGPRLEELSDARARSLAEAGVRVIGDPDLLRYTADPDAPDLDDPPKVLPTEAAAAAVEHAFAGMLKREKAQARRRAAVPLPAAQSPDPLIRLSSRTMLREVARRQTARLRRAGS